MSTAFQVFNKQINGLILGREVHRATTLNAGVFRIISSTGKILPGKTQRINVFCCPIGVKRYEETVLITLKEGNMQGRKGESLLLTVDGAVPNVNLDDARYLFQEIYVADTFNITDDVHQVRLLLTQISFDCEINTFTDGPFLPLYNRRGKSILW